MKFDRRPNAANIVTFQTPQKLICDHPGLRLFKIIFRVSRVFERFKSAGVAPFVLGSYYFHKPSITISATHSFELILA
jgi:hypothetical protein